MFKEGLAEVRRKLIEIRSPRFVARSVVLASAALLLACVPEVNEGAVKNGCIIDPPKLHELVEPSLLRGVVRLPPQNTITADIEGLGKRDLGSRDDQARTYFEMFHQGDLITVEFQHTGSPGMVRNYMGRHLWVLGKDKDQDNVDVSLRLAEPGGCLAKGA